MSHNNVPLIEPLYIRMPFLTFAHPSCEIIRPNMLILGIAANLNNHEHRVRWHLSIRIVPLPLF